MSPTGQLTLASLQGSGLLYFSEFVPERSQNTALGVWIVVVVMMVCECAHVCVCVHACACI